MAITVDAAKAKITISNAAKAKPSVFALGGGSVTGFNTHLTNGFVPGNSGQAVRAGDAFTATATVPVAVGAGDQADLKNWNFGFIQFQTIGSLTLYYTGAYKDRGETIVQAHVPPAMVANPGRDHMNDPNPPWLRVGTTGDLVFNKATGLASVTMGDHPMCMVGKDRMNGKSTYYNYLRRVSDVRTFHTIFSARDPAGTFQHLAHFVWSVTWDYEFQWKGSGTAVSFTPVGGTGFKMGQPAAGAPAEKTIVPFLKNPVAAPKLGTNEQNGALLSALKGSPTKLESAAYFGTVPDNFWAV